MSECSLASCSSSAGLGSGAAATAAAGACYVTMQSLLGQPALSLLP